MSEAHEPIEPNAMEWHTHLRPRTTPYDERVTLHVGDNGIVYVRSANGFDATEHAVDFYVRREDIAAWYSAFSRAMPYAEDYLREYEENREREAAKRAAKKAAKTAESGATEETNSK